MPKKQMNRNQRAKAVVGALGGGKRARKGVAKGITAVRKGAKAIGGNKQAGQAAARAGAGALKQASKSKMGREQRKKFFG
jgi:hypothetical protein